MVFLIEGLLLKEVRICKPSEEGQFRHPTTVREVLKDGINLQGSFHMQRCKNVNSLLQMPRQNCLSMMQKSHTVGQRLSACTDEIQALKTSRELGLEANMSSESLPST
jgi:hypothetical protein